MYLVILSQIQPLHPSNHPGHQRQSIPHRLSLPQSRQEYHHHHRRYLQKNQSKPNQRASTPTAPWGKLIFSDGKEVQLSGERALVGRSDHDVGSINPEVDLSNLEGADTTSRIHATIEHIGSTYTVTDLNSTNSTRINGKRLEPDKATPINDGDKLSFGKVTCTFKRA